MFKCPVCGTELKENDFYCPHCYADIIKEKKKLEDKNKSYFGFGFLSFFVPMLGLILFALWREEKPRGSKICGLSALVGFIISIVVYVIFYVIYIMIMIEGYYYLPLL